MKQRKNNHKAESLLKAGSVLLVLILILLWEAFSRAGILNPVVMPSPGKILSAVKNLWKSGALQKHILVSFKRVMTGYVAGAGLGILLGFVLSAIPVLKELTGFLLGLIRPIPPMALFPLFILWMGIGETSKIVVIAFVSFWPTFLNTEEGVRQADRKLLELAQVLKKTRFERIRTIIFPGTLPYMFAGLRLSISRAWGGVVVAEMLAASAGIGFLIEYSREMSMTANMMAGVIVIAVIGYLIDWFLKILHNKLCYWHQEE
jgi:sulfonate transport system permease protein